MNVATSKNPNVIPVTMPKIKINDYCTYSKVTLCPFWLTHQGQFNIIEVFTWIRSSINLGRPRRIVVRNVKHGREYTWYII